jgi:DNA helicase-2/ATP-dependent DNA helicase PcrA
VAEPTLGDKGKLLYKLISPYILLHYPEDHADRLHSLQELVSVMEEENTALSEFLEVFILDQGEETKHPETDITLSTIHSAKGLEWDSVILFNASGDIMPSRMAIGDAEVEEEKRLMYVALTRARYELFVTANDEMGGLSPFLGKVVQGTPIESTHELFCI